MKVFVAGGAGYLGTLVCQKLVEQGNAVTCCDIGWFGKTTISGVGHIWKDVLDIPPSLMGNYDAVIALSGLSCDPMADFKPGECFKHNTGAILHLAKIAKAAGVPKFIFASSASVYGHIASEASEHMPPNAVSHYGASKYVTEKVLMHLADDNFNVVCFRKGTLGGPSPRMRLDLMVNTITGYAFFEKKITVSNPLLFRPHFDVRDAADLYAWAVRTNSPIQGIYNAGFSNHTILEVAAAVQKVVPCEVILDHVPDCRNYQLNTLKLKFAGFRPTRTLQDTILDVLDWYKEHRDCWNKPEYYNIRVYKSLFEGERNV